MPGAWLCWGCKGKTSSAWYDGADVESALGVGWAAVTAGRTNRKQKEVEQSDPDRNMRSLMMGCRGGALFHGHSLILYEQPLAYPHCKPPHSRSARADPVRRKRCPLRLLAHRVESTLQDRNRIRMLCGW